MPFPKKAKVANSKIVKLKVSKPSANKPLIEGQTSRKPSQKINEANSAIEHNALIEPSAQANEGEADFVMRQLCAIFSHDQIALILSILKSKPSEVSIRDFLKEFSQSIKLEKSISNRVVDSGEYWKQQFESQCVVINEQQARIGILEKELLRCGVAPQKLWMEDSHEDEILNHLHPKKRTRISTINTVPDENDMMGTDTLALAYSDNHMMIASYLFRITENHGSLYAQLPTPALCRKLIDLAWKGLSDCILKYADVKEANEHRKEIKCLTYLVNEIIVCHQTCIEISTDHYTTIAGRELLRRSNVTFSLCSFFDKSLRELHKLCVGNAEPLVIGLITNLLTGILRQIDWQQKNELHKQIFEGILAVILNHIGKLMSNIIFGEDPACSEAPGGISSRVADLQSPPRDVNFLKSKYIIPILHVAFKIQEEKKMTGHTEALLKKAKKRIQNTLKNSMIGGSLLGMTVPERSEEEPIDIPELEELEMYSKEWTIQCVFTMIEMEDDEPEADVEMMG